MGCPEVDPEAETAGDIIVMSHIVKLPPKVEAVRDTGTIPADLRRRQHSGKVVAVS